MKKKVPITTTPSDDKPLPVIRIVSEEEEMHVKLELEMEDDTHALLVKWGKEEATDEDYINIAIREGLSYLEEDLHPEKIGRKNLRGLRYIRGRLNPPCVPARFL